MNIKTKFLTVVLLFISTSLLAQLPVRHNALRNNDYGVVYSLPVTQLDFEITITKTTYSRGQYYQFAKQYLNIDDPIVEDKVVYKLESVDVHNVGVPNKNNTYLIEFSSKSVEPFVYLTKDGLICSINSEPSAIDKENDKKVQSDNKETVNAQSLLTEEMLMAGSRAKQAELIAKQIFALRLSRSDILTGEAVNMPPDGEAYKLVMDQINMQEKALVEMFAGSIKTEKKVTKVSLMPGLDDIDRNVLFRFSEKLGQLDANDLAGAPVYMSLINQSPQPDVELSDKEIRRLQKKFSEGLVYNIPSKANLLVSFEHKTLINTEVDIVQYGTQDVLTKRMFDIRKEPVKVQFYPHLGAIKQITQ